MIESANPYAPSTAEDDAAPQAAVAGELRLAGLGRRFAANWIDLIFLCSPAFIYGMVEGGLGKLGDRKSVV